jgi:hypothetical protein
MSSIQYRGRLRTGTLCVSSRFGNHHNTALDDPCALQKPQRLSCACMCRGRKRPFNFVANISEVLLVVNGTRRNDILTAST